MFRGRVQGVYFSIITQALALIATLLFVGQQPYTGGTNGMTNFSTLFGLPLTEPARPDGAVPASRCCAARPDLPALRFLTRSRAGACWSAVRDDENRLRFFGYDPAMVKVVVFMLSAAIAGLAGALFVPQVGIISPAIMGIVPSIEMVIWVAVGGRGTLVGADRRRAAGQLGQERPERVVPGHLAVLPGRALRRRGGAVPTWSCRCARQSLRRANDT